DQPGHADEVGGAFDQPAEHAELIERHHVLPHVTLKVQHADDRCRFRRSPVGGSAHHPRSANRSVVSDSSRPRIASPSPRDTLAMWSASVKCAVASTTADAIRAGSELLKMPEPTKTASAPSCMTR